MIAISSLEFFLYLGGVNSSFDPSINMQPKPKIIKLVLILSMMVMGGCGLMYEYVLSVLGNYLMGTSYEQIFIIIGIMLFSMGIGSIFQRLITKNLLEYFLILEIILGLAGGTSTLIIYWSHASWESSEVILYGFSFFIGMFIGMEIPILIRINEKYSDSLKTNLSEILTVDYIGSLAGAILFTYVLLVKFSLAKIGFLLGITNTLLALVGLVAFQGLLKFKKLFSAAIFLVISLLITGFVKSDDWSKKIEQKYFRDHIIFSKTSRFQHIVLTKRKNRINLYINGHLQFSSIDEFIYHEYLVHVPMLAVSQKKKVLILGGGDGLALREVLKYPEVKEVTLVDIDPVMTQISSTLPELRELNKDAFQDARVKSFSPNALYPGPKRDITMRSQRPTKRFSRKEFPVARVSLYHLDADLFISRIKDYFDVIIIDFPDPNLIELSKLYSLEFYAKIFHKLNPGGFISIQASSPFFAREAFLCIGKTLQAASFKHLPYHGTVPSFSGDWGFYLAWKNKFAPNQVIKNFDQIKKISVDTKYLNPGLIKSSFLFGKNILTTTTAIGINSRLNPRLLKYYRNSWKAWE